MFFYVKTENLNWDILTKNLVIFKRWHAVNDESFKFKWTWWWISDKSKLDKEKKMMKLRKMMIRLLPY